MIDRSIINRELIISTNCEVSNERQTIVPVLINLGRN